MMGHRKSFPSDEIDHENPTDRPLESLAYTGSYRHLLYRFCLIAHFKIPFMGCAGQSKLSDQ